MYLHVSNGLVLHVSEADGALDKTRRHKKRQLEDTLHLVMKKRKVLCCRLQVMRMFHLSGYMWKDAGHGTGQFDLI